MVVTRIARTRLSVQLRPLAREHCPPAILRAAAAEIIAIVGPLSGSAGSTAQLIIEGQFLASYDVSHGIDICLVVERVRFAVRFAAMVDEARFVSTDRAVNDGVRPQAESINTRSLLSRSFREEIGQGPPLALVFNDACAVRYLALGKYSPALDPRSPHANKVAVQRLLNDFLWQSLS